MTSISEQAPSTKVQTIKIPPEFISLKPGLELLREQLAQEQGPDELIKKGTIYYLSQTQGRMVPTKRFYYLLNQAVTTILYTVDPNSGNREILNPTKIQNARDELIKKSQEESLELPEELSSYLIGLALLLAKNIDNETAGESPDNSPMLQIQDIWPGYQDLKEQIKGELISLGLASLQSNVGEDNKSETANT